MTKKQALNYLRSSGFSKEQIKAVVDALQEPTTKNDLAVDAVSRQSINGYIDYILTHGMGKKKSFDFIKKFVANLPTATPIRPKGHWIWCGGSHKCSNCGEYTCFSHKVKYCPNCGSDNREVEDGND